MIINSKQIILLYYLAFSLFVLASSCINPELNWDLIGYVASAKAFETDNIKEIHTFTYEHVRKALPPQKFKDLAGVNNDYRDTMQKDAVAFSLQLPLYRVRFLYLIIIFLLYKAGVDIVFATYFVSGISVSIAIWIIFLICKELRLAIPYMYILPPLALNEGILHVARLSSPDGLLFLGFVSCAYLFIKGRTEILLVLPILAAVRSDAVLFSAPFLLYLIVFGKKKRVLTCIALFTTLIIYWFVNWYCKYPGWSTIFYFTLVSQPVPYFVILDRLTIRDYLNAFIEGCRQAVNDKAFLVFVAINACWGYLSIVKARYNNMTALMHPEMRILFIFSSLYVTAHFLLFPIVWERFFVGQYLIVTIGFFEMLSSRMHTISEQASL